MLGPSSAIWMGLFCKEVKPGQQREDENEMTQRMHPSCTVGRAGRVGLSSQPLRVRTTQRYRLLQRRLCVVVGRGPSDLRALSAIHDGSEATAAAAHTRRGGDCNPPPKSTKSTHPPTHSTPRPRHPNQTGPAGDRAPRPPRHVTRARTVGTTRRHNTRKTRADSHKCTCRSLWDEV